MNEINNEKDIKIEQLIMKCNKQLDYIHELENQLKEKDKKIQEYKTIIQNNDSSNSNNSVNISKNRDVISNGIYQELCDTFFKIIEHIVKNNTNIENKRDGKVSMANMIVQATYFKGLIENHTMILSSDKVIKIFSDLGMLRFNENKNMPYFTHNAGGKSIRVVRISKDWVNMVKESMIQ